MTKDPTTVGTIELLKSGRYSIRLTLADGRRKRLRGTYATLKEAEAVWAATRSLVDTVPMFGGEYYTLHVSPTQARWCCAEADGVAVTAHLRDILAGRIPTARKASRARLRAALNARERGRRTLEQCEADVRAALVLFRTLGVAAPR